jgi:hypothetical protein
MLVETIEPLGAVDPAVEAVTKSGAVPLAGETDSATTGGSFAATVTICCAVAVKPLLPVAVAVTVYVPALL